MAGAFGSRIPKKYQAEDGDIKLVYADGALWSVVVGFNPEPAAAKNDRDRARSSGSAKKAGERARKANYVGEDPVSKKTFRKSIPVLTPSVFNNMATAAGDPSVTTFNFTWNSIPMKLVSVTPEANK